MIKQLAHIGEGIDRNVWVSASGKYRVLDSKGLGFWCRSRYVVQYLNRVSGQDIWYICKYQGRYLGSSKLSEAKQFAFSAEADGLRG